MLTILHGADFHLDSPFSGLPPEKAAQRRGEQRALLSRLADLAVGRRADLVLLCGDLFDTHQMYRETAQTLLRELGRIPCPVLIAPGNHDFYAPQSPYAALDWPENVHIFRTRAIETVPFPELGCTVHGAAFTSARWEQSPLADFQAPRDGQIHLMVLHGEVEGPPLYAPITREDIARSGLRYLALGHVHQCSGLQQAGDTFWAYPGCTEGRGFDETGEKGVLCLEMDTDSLTGALVPLGGRRYEICTVPLTGCDDPETAIRRALPQDTGEDIYRVILTGQFSPQLLSLPQLERALAPLFYSLDLRDHTRPPQALWARAGEDTLTGLFLQDFAGQRKGTEGDEQLSLALRFGMAALEGGEDVSP